MNRNAIAGFDFAMNRPQTGRRRDRAVVAAAALVAALPFACLPASDSAAGIGAPVSCDVYFRMKENTLVRVLQYDVDYSATGGEMSGSGDGAACVGLMPDSHGMALVYFHDEDGANVLTTSEMSYQAQHGPVDVARCGWEGQAIPKPSEFSITEIDGRNDFDGILSNVCGSPVTGANPPSASDASHTYRIATGTMGLISQECETDVDNNGITDRSDALLILQKSAGQDVTLNCPPCAGAPASAPTSSIVTVETHLSCTYRCPNVPDPACSGGLKSSLVISDGNDSSDSIKWKLSGGPGTLQSMLGDPSTSTTYSLCIYDSTGGVDSLVSEILVPAGSGWLDKSPKGLLYRDSSAANDGVTKIGIKAGPAGKSGFSLGAKGQLVPMPTPASADTFFHQDSRVVVQLHNNVVPTCWQSEFTTADTNSATKFSAKTP